MAALAPTDPQEGEPVAWGALTYNEWQLIVTACPSGQHTLEESREIAAAQTKLAAALRDVYTHPAVEGARAENHGTVHCKWCEAGDTPKRLDEDGVRARFTGKPGTWCHAEGDSWWPCPRFNAAAPEERGEPETILGTGWAHVLGDLRVMFRDVPSRPFNDPEWQRAYVVLAPASSEVDEIRCDNCHHEHRLRDRQPVDPTELMSLCPNCGGRRGTPTNSEGPTEPTYKCQGCGYRTDNSKAWVETHPCPECGKENYWTGSFVDERGPSGETEPSL